MNKEFKKIMNSAQKISLSEKEKQFLFSTIQKHVENNPLKERSGGFSSASVFVMKQYMARLGVYDGFVRLSQLLQTNLKPMPVALIIILALFGGTSFASQGALPGNILYPVKIHVNEKVESFLAIGAEAQASVDAKHALARVEEAEELVALGQLTETKKDEVKAGFERDINRTKNNTEKLVARGDFSASAKVNGSLETALDDHYGLFVSLAHRATSTKLAVADLRDDIKTKLDEVVYARINAEDKEVSIKAQADVQAATEGALGAAENKLQEVRKYINEHRGATTTVSTMIAVSAEVQAHLALADKDVADGKVKLVAHAYSEAFVLFKQAESEAQQAKLIFIASLKSEVQIQSILRNENTNNTRYATSTENMNNSNNASASLGNRLDLESDSDVGIQTGTNANKIESSGSGDVKVHIGL